MDMSIKLSRREFLGASAALAAFAAGGAAASPTPSSVALIGCGDRGLRLLHAFKNTPATCAWILCDVDERARSAANAVRPGRPCSDWEAALREHRPARAILAAPASVNTRALSALLPSSTAVYCDGLLARTAGEARKLLSASGILQTNFALHAQHPWQAHAEEASRLIQSGVLGELRWSQVCVHPASLSKNAEETILRQTFTALHPLFRATGAGTPRSVKTLGMASPEAAGLPESFSTEFRFADGHIMLLQCTRVNPAGLLPVIRGARASLEFHADHLAIIHHAPAHGVERIKIAPVSPLERWLANTGASDPAELGRALQAQQAACLALEHFSPRRAVRA